ncbi:MAG: hypothetical protein C4589_09130 [Peptococcaceae bacterium]|nr:MAG: hypothetical protein C4589_09130 [Peptococcaceae bacterium]
MNKVQMTVPVTVRRLLNLQPGEGRHEGTMDIKKRPNHKIYIQVLRQMSPEKRLLKAFELSEFTRRLFIHGLRKRCPNLGDEEFKKICLERLAKCHNRNY